MPAAAPSGPRGGGIAFLLAQLGSDATDKFADALTEIDLTPPLVGIMRSLVAWPGPSQQQLAERLDIVASRIVGYLDELESRGWIARARDAGDRRANVLTVTPAGHEAFKSIMAVAREHEARITAPLDRDEKAELASLLAKLSSAHGLKPGVHPGYRRAADGSA